VLRRRCPVVRTVLALAALAALAPAAPADDAAPPCCGKAEAAAAGVDLSAAYLEKSVGAKTAKDRYALGLWCRENGLLPEATAQFREAVRLDPEMAAARDAVGDRKVDGRWVPSEAAMESKGLVRYDGRWVLPEEKALLAAPAEERARLVREEDRARRLLETMASGDEAKARLAKEAVAGVDAKAKVAPLCFALRVKDRGVRLFAAEELGRLKDRRAFRPLVARALLDPDAAVRAACVDAAKAFGDPGLLAPFARAFTTAESADVRAAAAEAMGRTGNLRGVQILVYSMEAHGGGPRSYIYTANQMSFIQDFDVEVAQTAFIADPQVGILQDGATLDVRVVSSEWYSTRVERHAIVDSLRNLTGADLGDDAAAWRKWTKENREKLAAAR
jgi:HEAT repeat protein